MRHNVQILSVKRNVINIKFRKEKNFKLIPFCMGFIAIFMLSFSFGGTKIKDVGSSLMYVYNPVNSLYSDNSSIIFTSSFLTEKENLDFVLPMSGAKVDIDKNGNINLIVGNSIMVKSTESGVVEEVGVTLDGIKFVKVKHSLDVSSIIENVDIVGVEKGDILKKGQDIATAIQGQTIVLRLYMANIQLTNIKLNQSKIVWES